MTTIATATVLGGFWPTNGVNPLLSISGEDGQRKEIARVLGTRGQLRFRQLMIALMGVAPGAVATKSITQVGTTEELGGVRPIDTKSLINRATTAGDVTEIVHDYLTYSANSTFGANPPPNLDRNPLGTR